MEEVAVVTGASAGIGEAIAQRLLNSGHTVIALQRKPPRISHSRLIYMGADLSDTQQAAEIADEIARHARGEVWTHRQHGLARHDGQDAARGVLGCQGGAGGYDALVMPGGGG